MGSLESAPPLKHRARLLRPSSPSPAASRPLSHRIKSKIARFLIFEKVDFLHWFGAAAVFFFVLILFQFFLPGSFVERSRPRGRQDPGAAGRIEDLDFGEGIRFVPTKLMERFERERRAANLSAMSLGRTLQRSGIRRPRLALVVPDLVPCAMQLQMVSIALALKEVGYEIQIYSLEDGPLHSVWQATGMHVNVLPTDMKSENTVDWLDYNGVLVNSLEARDAISCLLQEPFKSVPVIWSVHETSLPLRLRQYAMNGQIQLINDWKQAFGRATVVVFPTHILPMLYSTFDTGNYYVIPGSPAEVWEADTTLALNKEHDLRVKMGYETEDFVVVIVGSQFSYSGMWLEHALVLQALAPLLHEFPVVDTAYTPLKVGIFCGNSTNTYKMAMKNVALNFGYPKGSIEQIVDGDLESFLAIADLVIYGSFLEEQSFPPVLLQAMSLGKLVVAPDLGIIRKYVGNEISGYLFPKENTGMLTQILLRAISSGKLSPLAQRVASDGKEHARNLMASETIQGYALLLENVLHFPSEVAYPKDITEIPSKFIEEWQWHLFQNLSVAYNCDMTIRSYRILNRFEEQWNHTQMETSTNTTSTVDDAFSSIVWEEEKMIQMETARKKLEEDELKDRTDQPHGTWEEVYRNAKKADRAKNELHERDERELERTGQPLCIYEPYLGEGTWPFLQNSSLYRGIGLSSKGRRPGYDDIDASSRLPLLSNSYYRDVLDEYGAFFALANRVDRIHKNAWIGFQSWRTVPRKACLSKKAETAILEAIQGRRYGDTLYFWVRMDKDLRNPLRQDFWSFCDSMNAGNCRFAVSEALRKMYGIQHDRESLPPMPNNGDSWSVLHSWVLPTRSFLEFVMFSRMFVDALDAQIYDEHHQSGHCYLSLSKDRHCYSRVLELLVNVWAYHSARRMVYVNPETGAMQEQHKLKGRRGRMWVRWFSYTTLKSMDEDLAEELDSDHPERRWLWPATGEVFWQGIYDRERSMRQHQKEKRKQQSKDKIQRIKRRTRQKTLGKFIKPITGSDGDLNDTRTA